MKSGPNRLNDQELRLLMALTRVERLGSVGIRRLLQAFERPPAVFEADMLLLSGIVGEYVARQIKAFEAWDLVDRELDFAARHAIDILHWFHPEYPFRLLHTPDAPVILFRKGRPQKTNNRCLAVVGTRKMTPYGQKFVRQLMEDLRPYRPLIISGLAYGIDVEAHRQAMANDLVTVAVMATPLHKVYPAVHQEEARQILEKGGALYSETWSSEKMDANFFLRRNRIVAGMAEATLVVESARKGGALTTAEMALSYNRDVFALPGRVTDTYSEGTNHLIKTEQARLVTGAGDIAWYLNWPKPEEEARRRPVQGNLFPELSDDERSLVAYLGRQGATHPDNMAVELQWPVSKVHNLLLMLELKGVVQALPGRKYELV